MNDLFLYTEAEDIDFFDHSEGMDYYEEAFDDYYGEDFEDYYNEDFGDEEDDDEYYYSEELESPEARFWPDELDDLEALEMLEDYIPEDRLLEQFAEHEADMFDDSEEHAEALREVMHEDYRDATSEEMQGALSNILETMTPAEAFNFKNVLHQVSTTGKKALRNPIVGKIARKALPIAGGALGTIVGGPVGTALGAKLGQAAAKAFSGGRGPASKGARISAHGGSAAAAQLLQLTQNPNILKSLASLALGANGRRSIQVDKSGPSVPVGGFMNLLSTLAGKAAADADEFLRESNDTSYLRDSEGEFVGDPAVPEERAQILYDSLIGTENQQLAADAAERYGGRRRYRHTKPRYYG